MKNPHPSSLRLALMAAAVCITAASLSAQAPAQAPAPGAAPAAGRGAGGGGGRGGRGNAVVSPEIGADRTITFRYSAPNAQAVRLTGEMGGKTPVDMTKDANGVWTAKVGPLAPDIYTYAFNVDGVVALDPRNPNTKYGYGTFGPVSVVQLPDNGPAFYDVKPVPHGEVRIVPYVSKSMGVARTVWIYTPPGYDKGKNYPVLYLMHGAGDIESGWTMIGRANNILDNLIAEKKAVPMVVVMPLGYTIQSFWAGPTKNAVTPPAAAQAAPAAGAVAAAPAAPAPGAGGPGGGQGGPATLSLFGRDLLEDVLPLVEANYKVSKKVDMRAIAGLSMGGGQTINIAFTRPELFRYVGLMSPASPGSNFTTQYPNAVKDPAAINKQWKLLWMSVGKDDTLTGPGDKLFHEALDKAGIKHEFILSEGRHEWTVWRYHLRDLAPLLFKK